ncbi:putative MFS family arabinose efflux permease [Nocardia tenerifensis]|uniref:Putative MFS family arabinose efflux permease n=1 Tax=Nocardia tenerifensis TaxID=228006 RepID=A0A318JM84_9NOCA|nr:MFS transporter [Nocardia tenerifensis]PXX54913.1 putative MFS family arabinose efflux permease [Nocardia tenerifensis]
MSAFSSSDRSGERTSQGGHTRSEALSNKTETLDEPTRGPHARNSARTAWIAAAAAVAAVGWGANQFAPLLLLYRSELHVSAATVQATYGLYAIGLIPGLLVAGPISDRFGRKRVLLPCLIISLLGSTVLMAAEAGPAWLFVGRLIAGMASGTAFSAGTAWIKELSQDEPEAGARRATIAMTIGFAVGPLVAGLIARWAPAPMLTAYVPHLVITAVAVALVLRTPTDPPSDPTAKIVAPLHLSARNRTRFLGIVLPLAPWVFGSSSIALAYLPEQVRSGLGDNALTFGAVTTALTMAAGIAIQPVAKRAATTSRLAAVALSIVAAGLGIAAAATHWGNNPVLIFLSTFVLGAGYGCCLVYGLGEVNRIAEPTNLGRLTAVFQSVAYTGFAAPYLLALCERFLSVPALMIITAALCLCSLAWIVNASNKFDR